LTAFTVRGYHHLVAGFFEEQADSVSSRVAVGLSKLGLAMKSQAWADAGQRRITPTQGQILALLRSRGSGALRLCQVAASLGISPPTASDSVRALVNKGFVRKTRALGDARAIALELTAEGQAEAERAAAWPDFLVCAIDALSKPEQEAFLLSLIKVIGVLAQRGSVPPQRMCITCRYFRANLYPEGVRPHHCALLGVAIGNGELRLDCSDHVGLDPEQARHNLAVLAG
jgi:DNA-binding MarR family transcriptional regulator